MKRRLCIADLTLRVQQLIWFIIGAIYAVSAAAAPYPAGQDAALKDVRIGEYKDHTRIVFEFDRPLAKTEQVIRSDSRMTVVFNAAQPRLVRKIPVERSQRLDDVQLWVSGNELSVVLLFDFANFRYESFRMGDPFRIALDVYPLAAPVSRELTDSATAVPQTPSSGETQKTVAPDPETLAFSGPVNHTDSVEPQDHQTIGQSAAIETRDAPAPLKSESTPSRGQLSATPETKPDNPPVSATSPGEDDRQGSASALQYYLVLGLVIITIVILALLAIMLLSRYRWTDENKPMKIDELLQKQDDRIASLNEMIQEQLKRYDEA